MSQKITWALIGCGRIAPNHIAAYRANSEQLQLLAVCDLAEERREQILAPLPEPQAKQARRYADYQDMLRKEQPALVTIATESGNHAAIGLDCIRAGCHVIIEKPIALSVADADALIQAARDKSVTLCACHQNRFNKSVQTLRTALEAGQLGRLLHGSARIHWNRTPAYYAQAPWRGTWAQDGGALMNQCLHNIDLLRWMMGGAVDEVFAYTDNLTHPYIQAEDFGAALVKFSNGSYGLIEGTTNVYPRNLEETLYVFGDKGTVKIGGKSVNVIEQWLVSGDTRDSEEIIKMCSETPSDVYGFGHIPLYADMAAAIREGRAPYVDGQAGKHALELVLAIYKSAAEGRPVKLPLPEASTLDFAGRFA